MRVHQIKYVPPSFVDMYVAEISPDDIARIPREVDEVVYIKVRGVGADGYEADAVQMILRKGKGYFRHGQSSRRQGNRHWKHLSNFNLKGKGKTLKQLWRGVPDVMKEDIRHLFAAAEELQNRSIV